MSAKGEKGFFDTLNVRKLKIEIRTLLEDLNHAGSYQHSH